MTFALWSALTKILSLFQKTTFGELEKRLSEKEALALEEARQVLGLPVDAPIWTDLTRKEIHTSELTVRQ